MFPAALACWVTRGAKLWKFGCGWAALCGGAASEVPKFAAEACCGRHCRPSNRLLARAPVYAAFFSHLCASGSAVPVSKKLFKLAKIFGQPPDTPWISFDGPSFSIS